LRGQGAGVPNLLGYPRAKPEQVRASDTLSREIPETPQLLTARVFGLILGDG